MKFLLSFGRENQISSRNLGGFCMNASHIWRFLANPGRKFSLNPCFKSVSRKFLATQYERKIVPKWLSLAIWAISSSLHMSGFFAGEKPSINHTSALKSLFLNIFDASPISRSSVIFLPNFIRWKPSFSGEIFSNLAIKRALRCG